MLKRSRLITIATAERMLCTYSFRDAYQLAHISFFSVAWIVTNMVRALDPLSIQRTDVPKGPHSVLHIRFVAWTSTV